MGCEEEVAKQLRRALSPEELAFVKELCSFHNGDSVLAHASLDRHLAFAAFMGEMQDAGALASTLSSEREQILQWFMAGVSAREAASRLNRKKSTGAAAAAAPSASTLLGAIAAFESAGPELAPLWLAWHVRLRSELGAADALLRPPATLDERMWAASLISLGKSARQAYDEIAEARRKGASKAHPASGEVGGGP